MSMSTVTNTNADPHISQLRKHLLDTLSDLRSRENPMDPHRARAIAEVASVLVDTAKVEVDYLRATNQTRAGFLEEPAQITTGSTTTTITPSANNPFPPGITGVRRHSMGD
ncbi:MAG: hypothetical protein LWW96_18185 [Acidovorax sp.]|uniref:hypothetical protein n=1 Tax=Acidovorax sp. TaxID=1872122 RepID=UPI0025BC1A3E|nr:hypothetical protein [Acidovorax sp.]MCE1194080.1 hypothetical protein [Acidovorax sp.]